MELHSHAFGLPKTDGNGKKEEQMGDRSASDEALAWRALRNRLDARRRGR